MRIFVLRLKQYHPKAIQIEYIIGTTTLLCMKSYKILHKTFWGIHYHHFWNTHFSALLAQKVKIESQCKFLVAKPLPYQVSDFNRIEVYSCRSQFYRPCFLTAWWWIGRGVGRICGKLFYNSPFSKNIFLLTLKRVYNFNTQMKVDAVQLKLSSQS